MMGLKAWRRPAGDIALIAALLTGLSFLPPDTSLQERQAAGVIRYCVGDLQSPLLQNPQTGAAGTELALMEGVADHMGLSLRLVEVKNMGRSFNPADWNISRGQCDILGGGLLDTKINRAFGTLLTVAEPFGLALWGAQSLPPKGSEIGVFLGSSGFDRLRLSSWMRAQGYRAKLLGNWAQAQAWRAGGGLLILSSLQPLPADEPLLPLPQEAALPSQSAVILWRGDTTFTRAFKNALRDVSVHSG